MNELDIERVHTQELVAAAGLVVELPLSLPLLFMGIAAWQLALRHPNIPPTVAEYLRGLIEQLQADVFSQLPATHEAITRGFDGQHDTPTAARSTLVLPDGL